MSRPLRFWPKESYRGVVTRYPDWSPGPPPIPGWVDDRVYAARVTQTWYLTPPALPDEEWPIALNREVAWRPAWWVQREWLGLNGRDDE